MIDFPSLSATATAGNGYNNGYGYNNQYNTETVTVTQTQVQTLHASAGMFNRQFLENFDLNYELFRLTLKLCPPRLPRPSTTPSPRQ